MNIHKILKNSRISAALLSQGTRAAAGLAMLYAISLLRGDREIALWYFLQGAAGFVTILDFGWSSFLSVTLASAGKERLLALRQLGLRVWTCLTVLGCLVGLLAVAILVQAEGASVLLSVSLVMAGAVLALAAGLMQALVQGEGLVAESLKASASMQVVMAVGVLFLAALDAVGVGGLAAVWCAGNAFWVFRLWGLRSRAINVSIVGQSRGTDTLGSLLHGRRAALLAFCVGQAAYVFAARINLTLLASAFDAASFARLAYTLNALQAIVSMLSFPMNGAVVDAHRSRLTVGSGKAWGDFMRLAVITAGSLTCVGILTLVANGVWGGSLHSVQMRILQEGELALAVVIVGVEAISMWFRPFGQAAGKLGGVLSFACVAAIASVLAWATSDLSVYLTGRLGLSLLALFIDSQVAKRAFRSCT